MPIDRLGLWLGIQQAQQSEELGLFLLYRPGWTPSIRPRPPRVPRPVLRRRFLLRRLALEGPWSDPQEVESKLLARGGSSLGGGKGALRKGVLRLGRRLRLRPVIAGPERLRRRGIVRPRGLGVHLRCMGVRRRGYPGLCRGWHRAPDLACPGCSPCPSRVGSLDPEGGRRRDNGRSRDRGCDRHKG